jgi:anti-sigma B factor antagonist
VVDLSEVTFLDSTGLGVLIKTLSHLRENGAEMAVVATTARVLKVLTITGMDQVMTVADSVPGAIPGAQ